MRSLFVVLMLFAFVSALEAGPVRSVGRAGASVAKCPIVRGAARGAEVVGVGVAKGAAKVAGWLF